MRKYLSHEMLATYAGLVAVHQSGRETRYTLTPESLAKLDQWIENIDAKWAERLLRPKVLLEKEQAEK